MAKPLAEIIIDAGLADRETVLEASRRSDASGEPFVVSLVRHSGLDELALVAAIRRQMRVALSDPAHIKLDQDALRVLSRAIAQRLRALPLSLAVYERGPRLLRVAMADPTDTVAVAELEHSSGCRIEVSLMPLSAVEQLVEQGYRSFVTEVMKRAPKAPASSGKLQNPQASGSSPRSASPNTPNATPNTDPETEEIQAASPRRRNSRDTGGPQPTTTPYHRLSDEADLSMRHHALLELMYEKNVISEDEYEEKVRQLMKREAD